MNSRGAQCVSPLSEPTFDMGVNRGAGHVGPHRGVHVDVPFAHFELGQVVKNPAPSIGQNIYSIMFAERLIDQIFTQNFSQTD